MTRFAEMAAATNYSFLRGASSPQDMVLSALLLGHEGIGIADRNTVSGVVRAYAELEHLRKHGVPSGAKRKTGDSPGEFEWVSRGEGITIPPETLKSMAHAFKLAVGSRLVFADGTPDIIAYPEDLKGWGILCRLLTLGNRRAKKGNCILQLADLLSETSGLMLIVMPDRKAVADSILSALAEAAPGSVWMGVTMPRHGNDKRRLQRIAAQAAQHGLALLATNDVLYAVPERRELQDVLTCIRENVSITAAGRRLEANAERHLLAPLEAARLFRHAPELVDESINLLARIDFTLKDLKYQYPDEPVPPGWEAQAWLKELTVRCAPVRYPGGTPQKVQDLLAKELALIEQLQYARYFLTLYDVVRYAQSKGILCQGRGSAANSAVCYVLGITSIDPDKHDVLFARFLSADRGEPPDIDVDFEHERREDVIQYIYDRYTRDRAGIAGTVISYRPRSAIRDVGKALGLSEDVTARIAGLQWGSWGNEISAEQVAQAGMDASNPVIAKAVELAGALLGAPRHLSQHVGGFVLTNGRLDEIVPIANAAMINRTFIEWDKEDIDTLELMKVDILALGMLTCVSKVMGLIRKPDGTAYETMADIPQDDGATYAMLQKGDSVGVFQVESRAQINMLPRLKPESHYDLTVQIAIVRPGPIQGKMVHPYLKRRDEKKHIIYAAPAPAHGPANELENILNKTLGVPLFQEQAMRIAMVAAEYSDVEANDLRRAMATFRNVGTIHLHEKRFVGRMIARGYDPEFAQGCFDQIKGFGSYGFPESHAAAFAQIAYVSSWMKCHHPAAFACALLNSQPMGFYAPAQIVRDAIEHGVLVRPIDVNESFWDNSLEMDEPGTKPSLRLGFRQIDGFSESWAEDIVKYRETPYRDIERLPRVTGVPGRAMRLLSDADAFRSLGLDRREALWAVRRLPDDKPLPLFAAAAAQELGLDADARLPVMQLPEHIVADYQMTRLSLKGHPMQLMREALRAEKILSCAEVNAARDGDRVRVAGVVLVRQRPGNGKAIFITLEDETGVVNALLWATQFEEFRRDLMTARLMVISGRIQRSKENVVHLMADHISERNDALDHLSETDRPTIELSRSDEFGRPQVPRGRHPRDARVVVKSRDFH